MTKIMVVDDEEDILYLVGAILKKAGYEVTTVLSGEECLERLKSEKPDLILLDIMMPEMDGWEVCKRIKEDKETKDILVVMLTVVGEEEGITKSFKYAKCDGHIIKPPISEKVLKTIEWVFKGKRGE